jgi:G3E family GTPase
LYTMTTAHCKLHNTMQRRRRQWRVFLPQQLLLLWCLIITVVVTTTSSARAFAPDIIRKEASTTSRAPSTLFTSSSSRIFASVSDDTAQQQQQQQQEEEDASPNVIPITILSGFLGSGKTTLLTQLLQNKEGLRIAVVVNDVASVNIDSKLVQQQRGRGRRRRRRKRQTDDTVMDDDDDDYDNNENPTLALSDGLVELQNGCACCSLSDELLNSVSELVTLSQLRSSSNNNNNNNHGAFQHIVVELSGVADPKQVRAKFQEAALAGMPLMDYVRLDTMVTVVDASMFESYFASPKMASRKETPELFYNSDGQIPPDEKDQDSFEEEEEEEWMKDMPPKLLEAVMAGIRGTSLEDESNGVAELLVSQTETADVVVLNKCDLVDSDSDVNRLQEIVGALNPRATTVETTYGQVPLTSILGVAKGEGVAISGAVDDHREYVAAALQSTTTTAESHCNEPACTDPTHTHAHSHNHDEPAISMHSHSHSHDHDCADPTCTDESHSHSHSHEHKEDAGACADPTCNDPGHSHVHSHQSNHSGSAHAGIGTFVYRARRPFHPGRLIRFLHHLPIVRGVPDAEEVGASSLTVSKDAKETLQSTLRSKGFCWSADSHDSAMYWSHAGASFEWMCLGQWWATLPRNQWPEGVEDYVLQDFDDPSHEDNKGKSGTVGDRRQEVVFIGPQFDSLLKQKDIQAVLDQCLLTSDEYEEYQSLQDSEAELQIRFANIMESKYVNF